MDKVSEAKEVLIQMKEDLERILEGFECVEALLLESQQGQHSLFSQLSSSAAVMGVESDDDDMDD